MSSEYMREQKKRLDLLFSDFSKVDIDEGQSIDEIEHKFNTEMICECKKCIICCKEYSNIDKLYLIPSDEHKTPDTNDFNISLSVINNGDVSLLIPYKELMKCSGFRDKFIFDETLFKNNEPQKFSISNENELEYDINDLKLFITCINYINTIFYGNNVRIPPKEICLESNTFKINSYKCYEYFDTITSFINEKYEEQDERVKCKLSMQYGKIMNLIFDIEYLPGIIIFNDYLYYKNKDI